MLETPIKILYEVTSSLESSIRFKLRTSNIPYDDFKFQFNNFNIFVLDIHTNEVYTDDKISEIKKLTGLDFYRKIGGKYRFTTSEHLKKSFINNTTKRGY